MTDPFTAENWSDERPTMALRFVERVDNDYESRARRILQQCWVITTRGQQVTSRTEWRDVPLEVES